MTSTPRPLRRDAQRNRELLVTAAREVFGAKGLDAPLEEIAKKAGVAIGTLYNRFPTRVDLVEAAFGETIDQWVAIGKEAAAIGDAWAAFTHFVVRTSEMQALDRGLADVCTRSFSDAPHIESAKAQAWEVLVRLVSRAQNAGVVRTDLQPGDVPLAVSAAAWASGIAPDDATWRRHVGYLLDGFRAR